MKALTIFIIAFTSIAVKAQNCSELSADISTKHVGIGFQYNLEKIPLWTTIHFSLSNQDLFEKLNDPMPELRIGYNVLNLKSSVVYGYITGGCYFSNNNYYSVVTPFTGLSAGYKLKLAQSKKHSLMFETGYRFGKKYYTQEYETNTIYSATKGFFRLNPFCFSVGYGYCF